jgi:hypothetical protein
MTPVEIAMGALLALSIFWIYKVHQEEKREASN